MKQNSGLADRLPPNAQGTLQASSLPSRESDTPATGGPPSAWPSVIALLQQPPALALLLGLLAFLLYLGTVSFPFVWDDSQLIVHNSTIRSWSNLPGVFAQDLWQHITNSSHLYYRPLLVTWFTLNYSLFQLHPWGWHLAAVLLHVVAVVAVFALLRQLALPYWTAALAALLFALHPVHVECVAWVSSSDVIVTLFFVLAFVAFLKSREPGQSRWLPWRGLSLFLLLCALLTKEMALTFFAIVALYVFLFPSSQNRSWFAQIRQSVLLASPYALLTAAYFVFRRFALHSTAVSSAHSASLFRLLLTLPSVLCHYLRLLVFPVRLSGLYYTPYVTMPGLLNFWLPLSILIASILAVWYWSRRTCDPMIAFAGFWLAVTLAPALYLPNFRNTDFVHDRYLYLPSVGFVILLAKAMQLFPRIRNLSSLTVRAVAAAAVSLAYSAGAYSQQVYWSSDLLLFYRAHSLYPQEDLATVELARELAQRGHYDRAIEALKPAAENRAELDRVYPSYYLYYLLGDMYLHAGNRDEARQMLDQAVAHSPFTPESHLTMTSVALLLMQSGDLQRASALCSRVLQSGPALNSTLLDCGNVYLTAQNYPEAEKLLAQAVSKSPEQPLPNYLLGRAYFETARASDAESSLQKAAALDPNVYDYRYWYGRALLSRGDIPDARREFQSALVLNPAAAEAKAALDSLPAGQ